MPRFLADRDLALDAAAGARTDAAASEGAHAAEALDADCETLARLLLRSEGVASSYIEGVSAPVVDVVLASSQFGTRTFESAAWVASNLAAIARAVMGATADAPLDVETLCSWHRTLMTGSPAPERYIGVTRNEQG